MNHFRQTRRGGYSLRDMVVLVACVVLLGTLVLAANNVADETQQRVRCASNLRQIGQALLMYTNEQKNQAYPRTIYQDADINDPVFGTPYEGDKDLGANKLVDPFISEKDEKAKYRPAPNDVTAALFLLMRTEDITSEVFVCPSTQQSKWDFGGGAETALSWTNWDGHDGVEKHLSYSFQNTYPSPDAVKAGVKYTSAIAAEFAILADMNPGGDDLQQLNLSSTAEEIRKGNSPNHGQEGQNVLYGDGHVDWNQSPFCGANRDNIYTFGSSGQGVNDGGTGVYGSAIGPNDSVLLPSAIASEKGVKWTMPKPEDVPALLEKLTGDYAGKSAKDVELAFTITETSLTITMKDKEPKKLDYDITGAFEHSIRIRFASGGACVITPTEDGVALKGAAYTGTYKRK